MPDGIRLNIVKKLSWHVQLKPIKDQELEGEGEKDVR